MDTIHDTRIDETPKEFIASCSCGWKRVERFGRNQPVPTTRRRAYAVALELADYHRGGLV